MTLFCKLSKIHFTNHQKIGILPIDMNCVIVYATESGSTQTACDVVADALRLQSHTVTLSSAHDSSKDMLAPFDALIVASPSWEADGIDGQPLPDMTTFLETLSPDALVHKKIAVLGLGDETYQHFCGAVDIMVEKLKTLGVTPVTEPLRIDRYYSSHENETKLVAWAQALGKILSE